MLMLTFFAPRPRKGWAPWTFTSANLGSPGTKGTESIRERERRGRRGREGEKKWYAEEARNIRERKKMSDPDPGLVFLITI